MLERVLKKVLLINSPINLSPHDGKIISNDEGNKELHGDWLLVTKKKKATNNSALNSAKTVPHKTNRYSALSTTPQKVKVGPPISKLPPRPKPNDLARANNKSYEPKRRRSEDTFTDPNFDSPFDFSSHDPTSNNKPDTPPHVARPTPHSHVQQKNSNPTKEQNSDDITMQVNNIQQTVTNNNNLLPTSETNNDTNNNNMHIKQNNGDDQVKPSTEHHDSLEKDMVT